MLVKKAPIHKELFQFLPILISGRNRPEKCIFFDIETTGLSAKNSVLYLIGAVGFQDEEWHLYQWFAETPQEERQILEEFQDFLPPDCTLVHYNGQRFDIPYLKYKYTQHGLPDPFPRCSSIDLFQVYKSLKKFLGLAHMKQTDLEIFLGITRPDQNTGKDCIKIYRDLIKYRDTDTYSPPLLCHNQWDLTGLLDLLSLTAYFPLLNGEFEVTAAWISGETFSASAQLPLSLPREIHWQDGYLHLFAEGCRLTIQLPLTDGALRQYYKNHREYYYLPAEDTALHKSVAAYTDRAHRIPATPQTCYTKFPCTEEFCQDLPRVTAYLKLLFSTLLC